MNPDALLARLERERKLAAEGREGLEMEEFTVPDARVLALKRKREQSRSIMGQLLALAGKYNPFRGKKSS